MKVEVSATPRSIPGWAPPLILVAAAVLLAVLWDALPERWIVHWGPGGKPDGWAGRSVGGVFGPLLLGLPILGIFELVIVIIRAQRSEKPELAPITEANVHLVRLVSCALLGLFAMLSFALPFGWFGPGLIVLLALIMIGAGIAFGSRRLSRATRAVREAGHAEGLEGYEGTLYRNPNDKRLWVPKLLGMGYTLNFAHRWAWPIMALLVGGPLLVIALAMWANSP